jgi:2-C-methyl-D-erythritol 4-phosphate cytidylyltransferase / 2-C-methyl-D-erythritol 2,4-cyclodiphosphate synthase
MIYAILLAAGHGTRSEVPQKQYTSINGKPLLWYSLKVLSEHPLIDSVVIVVPLGDNEKIEKWLSEWNIKQVALAAGGDSRQSSATAGFKTINPNPEDLILFHNAANPFVTPEEITAVLDTAQESAAAFVAHPVSDTLKQVKNGRVVRTIDRANMWQAQTPQVLRADLYASALAANLSGTDEMSLVESMGIQPTVVPASRYNKKITTPDDLEWAQLRMEKSTTRHGIGQDSHRFDRLHTGLTLGGIQLPSHPKMIANSDGDVMLHALCNALLQSIGEASLGSIADDMAKRGITDSAAYLEHVLGMVREHSLSLVRVGFQLEGATPQIDPIAPQLKKRLSELLTIDSTDIGITATTGEDLTAFGRGEGLQCFATVTLV